MNKSNFPISDFQFPKGIFSTSLFPTIEYISLLLKCDEIVFERQEHFKKQSNRSRFHILSPNGIQALQIPLVHEGFQHLLITDVKISCRTPWQRLHWRSIQAAYNRSPFFEFYKDELEELFFKEEKFLFNYNLNLLSWILKIIKREPSFLFTDDFEKEIIDGSDFRKLSDSKNNQVVYTEHFNSKKYNQVFGYKFYFIENLSVIDLIFNCGKNSIDVLG